MGMGKGGGNTPNPIDPEKAADAQIRVNQQTIDQLGRANRVGQNAPGGTVRYTQNPDGTWLQDFQLAPQQLANFNQGAWNEGALGQIAGNALTNQLKNSEFGQKFDLSKMPGMQGADDLSIANPRGVTEDINTDYMPALADTTFNPDPGARKAATDAVYGEYAANLDPQWARRDQDLKTELINQGVTQNSPAWNEAMAQAGQERSTAYDQARRSAVGQGMQQEQANFGMGLQRDQFQNSARAQSFGERLSKAQFTNQALGQRFGQSLQKGQFQNNARQQAIAEAMQARQLPLSELNQIIRGAQPFSPNFQGVSQLSPQGAPNMGNLMQQQYNGQMNQYNAGVGQQNQLMGMVGGLLGAMPW